jgi:hypothetical protein
VHHQIGNADSITIYIPQKNLLSVEQLQAIVHNISLGDGDLY